MIWLPEKKIIMPNRGILPNRAMRRAMPKDQRGFVLPGMFGAGAGPQGGGYGGRTGTDAFGFANVGFLLNSNGADASTVFTDASTYAHAITTVGLAQVDTAAQIFPGGSWFWGGGSAYLTVPNHAVFTMGSGDWTWEYYCTATSASLGTIAAQWGTSAGNTIRTFWMGGGTTSVYLNLHQANVYSRTVTVGTGTHVAWCRSGNDLRVFVNGTQAGANFNVTGLTVATPTQPLYIGNYTGGAQWGTHIHDLRFTVGARYTSNFTPDGPFPGA